MFQPLPSTMNPLGLCHFYPADPSSLSTLTPPKLPTTVDHLNNLLVLAKSRCRLYIIVVFEGGPVMPLGLLQELHSCHTLAHAFQSSCLKKPRTGTNHGYHVAHSAPTPSKMIWCSLTTSSTPIIMRTSCMWEMSGHCDNFEAADEEAHFRMPRTALSS